MLNRLDLIRSMPCCNCGASPRSQAAHSNFGEHGKGRGVKASDDYAIPLCQDCHRKFDTYSMGLNREQSKAWFLSKLAFVNQTINEGHCEPIF